MGFYTGRTGSVILDGKKVAKVQDWSLDTSVELLSTNDISSVVNTFTPGVKGATGSATFIYYRLEASDNASQIAQFTDIIGRIMKRGAITDADKLRLRLNVGGGADDNITIDVFVTQVQLSCTRGELTTVSVQFTMDGDFADVIE